MLLYILKLEACMRHHCFKKIIVREKSLRLEEMMMIIIIIIRFIKILQNVNKTKREYNTTKRKEINKEL